MNHFDPFVGLLSKTGWVLLHSVWQGALIGIVWGLIRFLMRRSSARARVRPADMSSFPRAWPQPRARPPEERAWRLAFARGG